MILPFGDGGLLIELRSLAEVLALHRGLEAAEPREADDGGARLVRIEVAYRGELPTVFLADHPVTGGYPVAAVVRSADLDLFAQARPGQMLTFLAG